MSSGAGAVNLNVNLRRDVRPEVLLKELALSPLIYIRLAGILFSIIVFGCVSDKLFLPSSNTPGRVCAYNGSNACGFAIAVGVIAFLLCLTFLVKDVLFVIIDYSEMIVIKKVLVMVDAIANGLWGFMWFVCFCFTADQRRKTNSASSRFLIILGTAEVNCANSGIAFSFFSIFVFGAIVGVNVFYFVRLMRNAGESRPGGGYASFPGPEGQSDPSGTPSSDYSPPEY